MQFEVGDRVRVIKPTSTDIFYGGLKIGDTGTIAQIKNNICMVAFDRINVLNPSTNTGYPMNMDQLELLSETIVIYHEGARMIAQDKFTGIKAQIEFTPADKHNFYISAKEVLDRLAKKAQAAENGKPIKSGDYVEVINKGCTYSSYGTWKGLKGYEDHFVTRRTPDEGGTYRVLRILNHNGTHCLNKPTDVPLALIQCPHTTQVFIIGIEGLRKDEEEKPWEI